MSNSTLIVLSTFSLVLWLLMLAVIHWKQS